MFSDPESLDIKKKELKIRVEVLKVESSERRIRLENREVSGIGDWYRLGGAYGPYGPWKDQLCRRAETFLPGRLDGD